MPRPRYRTVFLSDIHLGSPDCRADQLLDLLREVDAERWFLVGDIFDFWAMKRQWYWPQSHNDVVQKLLRKARKGAQVVYVPGNHDDANRAFAGHRLGGITVRRQAIHTTADGRRVLVLHGDELDAAVGVPSLVPIGPLALKLARLAGHGVNWLRAAFHRRPWSLAGMIARAQDRIGLKDRYRELIRVEARKGHFDGVLCGHIHWPELDDRDGLVYLNTGDWVDHCTAVVEHADGRLELLAWTPTAVAQAEQGPSPHDLAGDQGSPRSPARR
jgi:UDP-2,3-diacylglucosamine pyrophosphatase LpxH